MLFISFAGMINRYVSITWFYDNELSGNFLFLKDDEKNYTTYNNENYSKLIEYYIKYLDIKKIITYGPSMGGAASIIYGLKFKADLIIAIDPALIYYDVSNVILQINNLEKEYNPKLYINYTFHKNSENILIIPHTTKLIIDELSKQNMLCMIHPCVSETHLAFIPSKNYLINIIKLFTDLKIENYNNFEDWF